MAAFILFNNDALCLDVAQVAFARAYEDHEDSGPYLTKVGMVDGRVIQLRAPYPDFWLMMRVAICVAAGTPLDNLPDLDRVKEIGEVVGGRGA